MSAPIIDLLARYDAAKAAHRAAWDELDAVAAVLAARTHTVCVHHRAPDGDVWGTFQARRDNDDGWVLAAGVVNLSGDRPPDAETWAAWRTNDDLADRCDAAHRALFVVSRALSEAEAALLAAVPDRIALVRLLVAACPGWAP